MLWSPPPDGRPRSQSSQDLPTENSRYVPVAGRSVKAGPTVRPARPPDIERPFLGGGLERVAGVDRRRARTRCLLEQSASLLSLGRIGKGPGDQPPLLVGREHAARLKPGDEGAMIGEELAPERAQRILLGDGADLDAVARRAVIGGGRQGDGIEARALGRSRC